MPITCRDGDTNPWQRTQIGEELDHTRARLEGLWVPRMSIAEPPKILIVDALFQADAKLHIGRMDGGFSNGLRCDFRQRIEEFLSRIETDNSFDRPVERFPVVGFSADQRAVNIEYD